MGANAEAKIDIVRTISPMEVRLVEEIIHSSIKSSNNFDCATGESKSYTQKIPKLLSKNFREYWNLNFILRSKNLPFQEKRLKKMTLLFEKEIHHLKTSENLERLKNQFRQVALHLSKLNYSDINIEVTKTQKINFTLLFKDERILIVNKPFDVENDLANQNLIIYSIFENRDLVASSIVEISYFVNVFRKYLAS